MDAAVPAIITNPKMCVRGQTNLAFSNELESDCCAKVCCNRRKNRNLANQTHSRNSSSAVWTVIEQRTRRNSQVKQARRAARDNTSKELNTRFHCQRGGTPFALPLSSSQRCIP